MTTKNFFGFAALVLATTFAATGCAADSSDTEENGGTSADDIVAGKTASSYKEAALIDGDGFYCSGSIIAPRLALTAGHCADSSTFTVTAPYANHQVSHGTKVWTSYQPTGEQVNPKTLDVAVIVLDEPITLDSYPEIASSEVADGTSVVNVGRIKNNQLSTTSLYYGKKVQVQDGTKQGFPKSYLSSEIIESGDSGGPVYEGSGSSRKIVAVNSGAGGGTQVLARVDLAISKINSLKAQYK